MEPELAWWSAKYLMRKQTQNLVCASRRTPNDGARRTGFRAKRRGGRSLALLSCFLFREIGEEAGSFKSDVGPAEEIRY